MKLDWEDSQMGYASSAQIGRIGLAMVWWVAGTPSSATPYAAKVFYSRHKTGFASAAEARAWCAMKAEQLLREALSGVEQP